MGIELLLDQLHPGKRVRMLFLQVLFLPDANAVLACAGTAFLQGVFDDFSIDLLGQLYFGWILLVEHQRGVEVSIAHVT